MHRFKNILVVSDGAGSDADALTQAFSLARNTGGEVSALVVCPALPRRMASYGEAYEASLRDKVGESINAVRDTLDIREAEMPVEVTVESGDLAGERVVRRVLSRGHDLLIKQAECEERGKGFRAVDMDLLRKCPCPVWLSRSITAHREKMRVAVAIDPQSQEQAGRELSLELLRLARGLADMCSGRLLVISCWDYQFEGFLLHNPWNRLPTAEVREIVAEEGAEHRRTLDVLIDDSTIRGEIDVRHVRGPADAHIASITEQEGVDVLVMGTVARTGIPGLIMGNTAENVVRRLGCSLVALKPPGFVSPGKA